MPENEQHGNSTNSTPETQATQSSSTSQHASRLQKAAEAKARRDAAYESASEEEKNVIKQRNYEKAKHMSPFEIFEYDDSGANALPDGALQELYAAAEAEVEAEEKAEQEAAERHAAASAKASSAVDDRAAEARKIANHRERARALKEATHGCPFPVIKTTRNGVEVPSNAKNRAAVLDYHFGKHINDSADHPKLNVVTGKIDGFGSDTERDALPFIDICFDYGLDVPNEDALKKMIRNWAAKYPYNPLEDRLDEISRTCRDPSILETWLPDNIHCHKNDLNRLASMYIPLAIYNRIKNPGCVASVLPIFVGGPGSGKSRFFDMVAAMLTNDRKGASVIFDPAGNINEQLRDSEGNPIWVIDELAGYSKGEANKFKSFTSRIKDTSHAKFLDAKTRERSFMLFGTSNTTSGIYRDETGERRVMAICYFQRPDKDGQKDFDGNKGHWDNGPRTVDFIKSWDKFDAVMLEVFGACRVWMETHGEAGYVRLEKQFSNAVAAEAEASMAVGSGTIKDELLENHLIDALINCPKGKAGVTRSNGKHDGGVRFLPIKWADFKHRLEKEAGKGRYNFNADRVERRIKALGGEVAIFADKTKSIRFFGIDSQAELIKLLRNPEDRDYDELEGAAEFRAFDEE